MQLRMLNNLIANWAGFAEVKLKWAKLGNFSLVPKIRD